MKMKEKFEDLNKLVSGLDISPSMHQDAENKYKALGEFLKSKEIECDIYPQGSFALGTTIRPLKENKHSDYDLDFICLLKYNKNLYSAFDIRNIIEEALKNSIYKDKLTPYDKCLTISYAQNFNIDILPSVYKFSEESNYILITHKKNENNVEYFSANPKDYVNWFENINLRYPSAKENTYSYYCESVQDNKIEELPSLFKRTSLQRVIQILKYHRDHYYSKRKKNDKKVISAIITTICTQIADEINRFDLDIENLLKVIVDELKIYSLHLTNSSDIFDQRYSEKKVIKKTGKNWEILNPVNSEDNLADQWNNDEEKAQLFFEWIEALREEFLSDKTNDIEYLYSLENIFGESYVSSTIDTTRFKGVLEDRKEINQSQPWRENTVE